MSVIFRAISRTRPALMCRSFSVSSSSMQQDDAVTRFQFGVDGYNKLGLLHDDLYCPEICPIAAEAVRRLPEEVQMQRVFRAIRAQQLGVTRSILPKEEWTKFEDDNFYLQPYLDEVIKERQEIEEWEANH